MHGGSPIQLALGVLALVIMFATPAAIVFAGVWGATSARRYAIGALAARPEVRLARAGFICVAVGGGLGFLLQLMPIVVRSAMRGGGSELFWAEALIGGLVRVLNETVGLAGIVLLAWGIGTMLRARRSSRVGAGSLGEAGPSASGTSTEAGGDGDAR